MREGGEPSSSFLSLKKYIPRPPNPVPIVGLFVINGTATKVLEFLSNAESIEIESWLNEM
jgi:hypothetical protein